jgi:hypothetical protein
MGGIPSTGVGQKKSLFFIQSQWKAFLLILDNMSNNWKPELNNTFLTLPLKTGSLAT